MVLWFAGMLARGIYRNGHHSDYKVTDRLDGKVAIVTGANVGIGKVTALELAKAGAHVILASRSADKTAAAINDINATLEAIAKTGAKVGSVEFLKLDLASFASIRQFVEEFKNKGLPLHLLVNNAGLGGLRGKTEDGLDLIYGTNHVGHVLLTALLLPKIRETIAAEDVTATPVPTARSVESQTEQQQQQKDIRARVVFVASEAHYFADNIDYNRVTNPILSGVLPAVEEYSMSKLAMVLFGQELARILGTSPDTVDHKIGVYIVHPGVVASDVWRSAPFPIRGLVTKLMLNEEQGAMCTLYATTSSEVIGKEGKYFEFCKETHTNKKTGDQKAVEECWKHSLEVAKLTADELSAAHITTL